MKVRGSASFPAARRAAEIKQSIIEAAQDERLPADAVTIEAAEDRTLLLAGERLLLDIFDADAEIEGLSRELLAEDRQGRIQEVIAAIGPSAARRCCSRRPPTPWRRYCSRRC
jgi:hypothetical protein